MSEETLRLFEMFWKVYPRKVGKGAARTAFVRALTKVEFGELMEAVTEFAGSDKGKSGQFCPHARTWLSQERWDDDRSQWNERRLSHSSVF